MEGITSLTASLSRIRCSPMQILLWMAWREYNWTVTVLHKSLERETGEFGVTALSESDERCAGSMFMRTQYLYPPGKSRRGVENEGISVFREFVGPIKCPVAKLMRRHQYEKVVT